MTHEIFSYVRYGVSKLLSLVIRHILTGTYKQNSAKLSKKFSRKLSKQIIDHSREIKLYTSKYSYNFFLAMIRVVLVYLLLIVCAGGILFNFEPEKIDSGIVPFQQLSRIFCGCHFRFIFWQPSIRSLYVAHKLEKFPKFIEAINGQASVSINHEDIWRIVYNKSRLYWISHETCLILVNVYSEKGYAKDRSFYYYLSLYLDKIMKHEVWPNHFIFAGDLKYKKVKRGHPIHYGKYVYFHTRGIVLHINHTTGSVNLICFPWFLDPPKAPPKINLTMVTSQQQLSDDMRRLNFDMYGNTVYAASMSPLIYEILCSTI